MNAIARAVRESNLRAAAALLAASLPALAGLALVPRAAAQQWELAPSMPAPKANTAAFKYQGAIYMLGGSPWMNGGDQDGSVYKLANGAWTATWPLDGIGASVGQGAGVDALGRILFFGGIIEGSGDLAASRFYKPATGTWGSPAQASIFNPPQNFGVAVDGQNRIYRIAGGCDDCLLNSGTVSRYDGTTDTWQQVAYVPYTRSSVATTYDGQGHIWGFGGYTSFGLPRIYDTIRYTVATDTWDTLGSLFLPVQTSDARAALGANGIVYCVGGQAGAYAAVPTTAVHMLDPGAPDPHLLAGPPLNIGRYDFGLVLGDDGYLYAMGGMTASGPTATVERLYTGACASAIALSGSQQAVPGQSLTLVANASGGAPLDLQWKRDGVALSNGATGHGSSLAGVTTNQLSITNIAAGDAGTYTLAATNPCGTATTSGIVITVAGAWSDLGLAKPGSLGIPHLAGSGTLAAGSSNQLTLTGAPPATTATLVFGLSHLDAPFKGGTLVPSPLLIVPLGTDGSGGAALPFTWPAGVGAGVPLLFQFWIQDAGATHGLSASNALQGLTS